MDLIIIIFGYLYGRKFHPKKYIEQVFFLALILFIFFCTVYAAPNLLALENPKAVLNKLVFLGIGVCVFTYWFSSLFYKKKQQENSKRGTIQIKDIIKIFTVYLLLSLVFVGGIFTYRMDLIDEQIALSIQNVLIYIILFLIGVFISASNIKTLQWHDFKLPIIMVLANTIFACFMLIIWKESAVLLSGFGWASLSAAMISQKLNPLLAVQALIVDMIRGLISIIFLELFGRHQPQAAISTTGVLSCDAFLPMIKQHCGEQYVLDAFKAGLLLSLFCPLNIFIAIHFTQSVTN